MEVAVPGSYFAKLSQIRRQRNDTLHIGHKIFFDTDSVAAAFDSGHRVTSSDELRRGVPRSPRPLEVETAQMAAHIQHFTDKVQAGALQRLHGLG